MPNTVSLATLTSLSSSSRLFPHLSRAFSSVPEDRLDHAYLHSDAFRANAAQAARAAEIAESDSKLALIARALAGCALVYPAPAPDRFQGLRIVEALSEREAGALGAAFDLLDPMDPYADSFAEGRAPLGFSRAEFAAALYGLRQLGLLSREPGEDGWVWRLTPLARSVATLCRLGQEE